MTEHPSHQEYSSFAPWYDQFMQDADYDRWYAVYRQFLPFSLEGLRIADLCCGTGQITRRLKQDGALVIGVDRSQDMLSVAQEQTRKAGMQIPYVCQDIQRLELPRRQDAILCVCDGINYLCEEELDVFLHQTKHYLKKDGVLLFDISTKAKLLSQQAQPYFDIREDAAMLWQSTFSEDSLTMQVTGFILDPASGQYNRFDEEHVLFAYETTSLIDHLQSAGFYVTDVLDLDTGKQETAVSQRCIYRAIPQGE